MAEQNFNLPVGAVRTLQSACRKSNRKVLPGRKFGSVPRFPLFGSVSLFFGVRGARAGDFRRAGRVEAYLSAFGAR
jgi:hypothetical protein